MKASKTTSEKKHDQEFIDLACLYEITRHLASASSLQDCLEKIVTTLAEVKGMSNGTVSIINPVTGELEIEVAYGISAEAKRRGRYKLHKRIGAVYQVNRNSNVITEH